MQVPSRTYKEEKMISCDNMYPYMNNIKQRKKPPKVKAVIYILLTPNIYRDCKTTQCHFEECQELLQV